MKYRLTLLLLLLWGTTARAEDTGTLVNFKYVLDGSEALLASDQLPTGVKDNLNESVGIAFVVRRVACTARQAAPCYRIVNSTTAFAVGDHEVITNFHLFDDNEFVLVPVERQIVSMIGKRRAVLLKIFFHGLLYDADPVNQTRYDDQDLVAIAIRDPGDTFRAKPISFAPKMLNPGIKKFYTLGFYDGCVAQSSDPGPDKFFCLTPGLVQFQIFIGYSTDIEVDENVGALVGEIPSGFSGSPLLDERGVCVGVNVAHLPNHLRAYFIPSPDAIEFLKEADHWQTVTHGVALAMHH